MPSEKYTRSYLEEQLPVEVREHLRADGHDPTRLPSYEYLQAKGFETRGLNRAIKRHFGDDLTLNEFLSRHGFGHNIHRGWPCDDEETLGLLDAFKESRIERHDDASATIKTVKSAMTRVLHRCNEVHGTDAILKYARADSKVEERIQNKKVEEVIDELRNDISDGAADNYTRYWKEFYEFAKLRKRVDYNPVAEVLPQYRFQRQRSEPERLSGEQLRTLWKTLHQLPERHQLEERAKNLIQYHGLEMWRLYMMVLLVFLVSVGPRAKEVERTDLRRDWQLGTDDPYIEFPIRKNLPGEVPVLAHPAFLRAFRDFMEERQNGWNGNLIPSETSGSGCRSTKTINSWLSALCQEAGVTLEGGSYPTLQNFRQTWQNEYHAVLRRNEVQLELVADEAGTKTKSEVAKSYRTTEEERMMIRALAAEDFEELLPLDSLPQILQDAVQKKDYIDHQASLNDFES